jgi:hypothetical protein
VLLLQQNLQQRLTLLLLLTMLLTMLSFPLSKSKKMKREKEGIDEDEALKGCLLLPHAQVDEELGWHSFPLQQRLHQLQASSFWRSLETQRALSLPGPSPWHHPQASSRRGAGPRSTVEPPPGRPPSSRLQRTPLMAR